MVRRLDAKGLCSAGILPACRLEAGATRRSGKLDIIAERNASSYGVLGSSIGVNGLGSAGILPACRLEAGAT